MANETGTTTPPFVIRDDTVTDLPPIIREDDENTPPAVASTASSSDNEPVGTVQVRPEQMRNILGLMLKGGFLYYGDEHWIEGTEEEIDLLVPMGIRWVNRWPALAAAVDRADMESFPVAALYVFGKRIILSERMKKEKRSEKNKPSGVVRTPEGRGEVMAGGSERNQPLSFD